MAAVSESNRIADEKDLKRHLVDDYVTPTPRFLRWIADRLVHVYGEPEGTDFVLSLRARAKAIEEWEQE